MSDQTPAPTEAAETTAPETPAQEPTDWKAEARKWEARAKENSTAAKRLAEIEDAAKSDLEKAQARAEAAEKRMSALTAETMRLRVLADAGIPADYADLVVGEDEEALRAAAKKVQTLLQSNAETPAEPAQSASYVIGSEGTKPSTVPLNSDALTEALEQALGIRR